MRPTLGIACILLVCFTVFFIEALLSKKAHRVRRFICQFVGYTIFMIAFIVSAIDAWDVKHIWRNKEDKAFEEAIEEALRNTGEFAPQAFFGDADTVCFVPPYGSPQSIDRMIDLTPKARKDLNGYLLNYLVNDFNRRDDIWWVFGFKNGNVEFSRKMVVYDSVRVAGFNAPARRETQCFASDRIILKSSSMNEFYVTERNR